MAIRPGNKFLRSSFSKSRGSSRVFGIPLEYLCYSKTPWNTRQSWTFWILVWTRTTAPSKTNPRSFASRNVDAVDSCFKPGNEQEIEISAESRNTRESWEHGRGTSIKSVYIWTTIPAFRFQFAALLISARIIGRSAGDRFHVFCWCDQLTRSCLLDRSSPYRTSDDILQKKKNFPRDSFFFFRENSKLLK